MATGGSAGCREIFEILVICVDLYGMLSSLHVDPLLSEPLDHGEELFVVYREVELGKGELS